MSIRTFEMVSILAVIVWAKKMAGYMPYQGLQKESTAQFNYLLADSFKKQHLPIWEGVVRHIKIGWFRQDSQLQSDWYSGFKTDFRIVIKWI